MQQQTTLHDITAFHWTSSVYLWQYYSLCTLCAFLWVLTSQMTLHMQFFIFFCFYRHDRGCR
jgi:hypothetical protein